MHHTFALRKHTRRFSKPFHARSHLDTWFHLQICLVSLMAIHMVPHLTYSTHPAIIYALLYVTNKTDNVVVKFQAL